MEILNGFIRSACEGVILLDQCRDVDKIVFDGSVFDLEAMPELKTMHFLGLGGRDMLVLECL